MSHRTPIDDTVQLKAVMPNRVDNYPTASPRTGTGSNYAFEHSDSDSENDSPKIRPRPQGSDNEEPAHGEDSNENSNPKMFFSKKRAFATVGILLFVNLLNYMDRFTIAGVLIKVRNYYHDLSSAEAGIIQTAFICSYMVFSPIFGYLGDRYTRKYLMAGGIFLWSGFTMASSFVPADSFWLFVVLRALVGIGEASYSTIAPTIIADLFAKDMRTRALMVFYFAIPVGSGLGYIVGSNVADLFHKWEWALRVTPVFGVISVILIILFCLDPPRGMSETNDLKVGHTSVLTDAKVLLKNKSFMLSTMGFTCVAFVTGALAFLAPSFMVYSTQIQRHPQSEATISLIFGAITVAAGFIGVALGAELSRRYRRINTRADPLVCAFGMLTCVPFLFFALYFSRSNTIVTWILIFLGETMLCLNWAVTADILLYVVVPTRRSLAESGQILLSHALGDAISPYIVGVVSDALASRHDIKHVPSVQFGSMQTALYLTTFVCVIGGGFYLATAIFIDKDRRRAEMLIHGSSAVDQDEYAYDDLVVDGSHFSSGDDEDNLIPSAHIPDVMIQSANNSVNGERQRNSNLV